MSLKSTTIEIDGKSISLETGLLAVQSNAAVVARSGDTMVLATVVSGPAEAEIDYFPLTVEYREKLYAGGLISSSRFIKREGRPTDTEILTSRLIDRSIRPLFPSNYFDQVQVIVTPLSVDGEHDTAILSILAASAALRLSSIPWSGPVGAVRVGMTPDGKYIVNPTTEEKKASLLDLVVAGGTGSLAMVEAGANEVTEAQVLEALKFGQEHIDSIVKSIEDFASDIAKEKLPVLEAEVDKKLLKLVKDNVNVEELVAQSKTMTGETMSLSPVIAKLLLIDPTANPAALLKIIDDQIKEIVRARVLNEGVRFDGRKPDEIRNITAQVGLIPRVHGSAFFQRGLTHALSIVTLGSPSLSQLIEGMYGEETKRYMHHYNMPPYATGEPGRIGAPNRREIGHGNLAERALLPVIPAETEFPYTIRVVSEIMSSNGSTSQASVCGSTLSLMDAGVPIKKPVAGIAMGLMTDGKDKNITLSDIAGLEDHIGDMDFKVAGTADGITAMQMDVKVPGVSPDILGSALEQAHTGRLFILAKMLEALAEPRKETSKYAPRIVTLQINPEKIGELIGPGGKMIRKIQADYDVQIDIEETGLVSITGLDPDSVNKAKDFVHGLTAEVEIGRTYQGPVTRVESFGAFVDVHPSKSGMIHVSKMNKGVMVADAGDVLSVGDLVTVRADEIDDRGRLNLTLIEGGRTPDPSSASSMPSRPRFDRDRNGGRSTGERRPSFKRFRDSR